MFCFFRERVAMPSQRLPASGNHKTHADPAAAFLPRPLPPRRYEQELRDPREYENWLAEQRAALQAQDEERAAALKREVEETKERARQAEQKAQEDNLAAARAAKEAAAAALEALSQVTRGCLFVLKPLREQQCKMR